MTEPTRVRSYRTALDPTTEQRKALGRQAGAARWAYNWALARWRAQYEEHKAGSREKPPSWMALHKDLTAVKREPETAWLREVSAYAIREALADLGAAYQHFWRRLKEGSRGRAAGEPQFRSRQEPSGRGFRIAQPSAIDVRTDAVKIAGVGWVRLAERAYLPVGANYRGLAAREVAGRWHVAVQVEEPLPAASGSRSGGRIGVEVGVRVLAQTSDGDSFGAVRDLDGLARAERRRRLWERRMSRRYQRGKPRREQSAGWREAVREVGRLHARCADIRRDTLQQTSTRIVRRARGATLVLRDMQVARMLGRAGKSGPAARARNAIAPMVSGVGMYELRRQLEYKQAWRGAAVEVAPSDYPSTRMCSACAVVRDTDPGYPSWRCADCGARHDREMNSARNLRDYDFAGGNPGGSGGRAGRRKTPRGAQRPREPDHSATEASTAPATGPDERGAVSAALALLGSGNRATGEQSSVETGGLRADPTGGAVSAPRTSISAPIAGVAPIERRGDAPGTSTRNQAVVSRRGGRVRGRSQRGAQGRRST